MPLIPTARFGKTTARSRRMHNWATTQDGGPAVSGASIWVDYRDIAAAPTMSSISDPTAEGQFGSLGINTTSGGTWGISATNDILFGGSWVSSLTFTGAGSYALLTSTKYSNTYRWAVVSSKGVT